MGRRSPLPERGPHRRAGGACPTRRPLLDGPVRPLGDRPAGRPPKEYPTHPRHRVTHVTGLVLPMCPVAQWGGGATRSRAAEVARAASPWSHRRLVLSFPCPDTGIHAPSPPPFSLLPRGRGLRWGSDALPCCASGAGGESMEPWARLAPSFPYPDTGIHAPALRLRTSPGATPAPPTNAPIPLPCLLKPVLSRSKGIPETPGAGAPACRPRFTSKCRKMSHYFGPPLVNPCNLRVRNLTIWARSRPF